MTTRKRILLFTSAVGIAALLAPAAAQASIVEADAVNSVDDPAAYWTPERMASATEDLQSYVREPRADIAECRRLATRVQVATDEYNRLVNLNAGATKSA